MVDGQLPDNNKKMKNKLIVFLLINKITKYEFERYDAHQIGKKMDFEFHQMTNLVYPKFLKIFMVKKKKHKNIKIILSFAKWKKEMLKKKLFYGDNIIIYNAINVTNYKSFIINYFLFKNKFKTLVASNLDHPIYGSSKAITKFKIFCRNIFNNKKKIKYSIEYFFFKNLAKILKMQPKMFLKYGSLKSPYESMNNVKILKGNSLDYNMYLKTQNETFKRKYKYALFLESVLPVYNLGDAFISKDDPNSRGTREEWLISLNNFFSKLEKTLNLKILICQHPKIKNKKKFSEIYNGREIVNKKLAVVTKNCELIVTRDSTGVSFSVIYNKPLFFVYNNELLNLNLRFIKNQKYFAKELGLKPINMDNNYSDKQINKFKNFDKNIYLKYKTKYLTSRNDKKKNYQIIEKALNY